MEQPAFLVPFDVKTQDYLTKVDNLCSYTSRILAEASLREELSGEGPHKLSPEEVILQTLIRGFGILYNRSIEAGWIEGRAYLDVRASGSTVEETKESKSPLYVP